MGYEIKKRQPKTPERALAALEFVCSKMERCRYDARQSLKRWEVSQEAWEGIIEKLEKDRYIDESRYTRFFIGEKLRAKTWGVSKIKFALKMKQIPDELINQTLSELIVDEDVAGSLFEKIASKARREYHPDMSRELQYKLRVKLFKWAGSRGFEMSLINDALDKFFKQTDYD